MTNPDQETPEIHAAEGPDTCPVVDPPLVEPVRTRSGWRGLRIPLGVVRDTDSGFVYQAMRDPLDPTLTAVVRYRVTRATSEHGLRFVRRVRFSAPAGHLVVLDAQGDVLFLPRSDGDGHAANAIRPFTDEERRRFQEEDRVDHAAEAQAAALGFRLLRELDLFMRSPGAPTQLQFDALAARAGRPPPAEYVALSAAVHGGAPLLRRYRRSDVELDAFFAPGSREQLDMLDWILQSTGKRTIPVAGCGNGDAVVLLHARFLGWRVRVLEHEQDRFRALWTSLVGFINGLEASGSEAD